MESTLSLTCLSNRHSQCVGSHTIELQQQVIAQNMTTGNNATEGGNMTGELNQTGRISYYDGSGGPVGSMGAVCCS